MARLLRRLELALVEEIDARRRQATIRRILRDSTNPFEVSDDAFLQYFRVPKVVAQFLCTELQPHLARVQRRGLTVHCQVLVTLRFLAEGGYQRGVGQDALLSVSQPSICDDQMKILNICTYPGSVHDHFIWSHSRVRRILMDAYRDRFGMYFLIGDSGYALEPWLLTPLPHAEEGTPEFRYTAAHCATRSVVERLFGVLKGRWRCLLRDRTLHYHPQRASDIISVCAILHNILLHFGVPLPEEPEEERDNVVPNGGEPIGDALARARRIQNHIIHRYFT
ncbi:putative nuclease HARBI1 [Ischnura elegans]|uniref:putative nuclease HARBI1 n=1 Tax=Ischnura elegans TaxID=197161 RepID=UPI001ED8BD2B|nr:putative nuclease HARBI1 [Ischnura elegans]